MQPVFRKCTCCLVEKSLTEDFYKHSDKRKHRSGGYHAQCKKCMLEKNRKYSAQPKQKRKIWENKIQYRYGITLLQYETLLKNQNGSCAICNTKNPSVKNKKNCYFSVDHCHDTGRIRGLLCPTCNSGIGFLKDNPQIILKAAEYLRSA